MRQNLEGWSELSKEELEKAKTTLSKQLDVSSKVTNLLSSIGSFIKPEQEKLSR